MSEVQLQLNSIPKKLGRPPKADKLTPAQRKQKERAKIDAMIEAGAPERWSRAACIKVLSLDKYQHLHVDAYKRLGDFVDAPRPKDAHELREHCVELAAKVGFDFVDYMKDEEGPIWAFIGHGRSRSFGLTRLSADLGADTDIEVLSVLAKALSLIDSVTEPEYVSPASKRARKRREETERLFSGL